MQTEVPFYIGSTIELIAFSVKVPQFLSGIFLALPKSFLPPVWSRSFDTEDNPFEEMDEARFEIRTFDTSYFEMYAPDAVLLQVLVNRFGGTIENN